MLLVETVMGKKLFETSTSWKLTEDGTLSVFFKDESTGEARMTRYQPGFWSDYTHIPNPTK